MFLSLNVVFLFIYFFQYLIFISFVYLLIFLFLCFCIFLVLVLLFYLVRCSISHSTVIRLFFSSSIRCTNIGCQARKSFVAICGLQNCPNWLRMRCWRRESRVSTRSPPCARSLVCSLSLFSHLFIYWIYFFA
jgi:hypothetical protein